MTTEELRNFVRERAGNRCEYCRIHEAEDPFFSFHLEHITACQHGGGDELENLAWSCQSCNLSKGPNLTSVDPETLLVVLLFHPRRDRWTDHFKTEGPLILGTTPSGRATSRLLKMNEPDRVEHRALL